MDHNLLYPASNIPDNFKTPLAGLYKALKPHGIGRAVFLECLQSTGYSVSGSQLDRWVARLDTTGQAIIPEKKSGAPPSLTREQKDAISGWILNENAFGRIVSLTAYRDYALGHFHVELSAGTASNYLSEDGFAYRLVQQKGKSFDVDVAKLRRDLWNWVQLQNFRVRKDRLASIDFTFTGHRTERRSGFAPRGAPQPMEATRTPKFTNCIVTVVWADGINRTPPILFTYDSAFRIDRNPTQRRVALTTKLREFMTKYNITPNRIKYIGKSKNETRTFVRECPEILRLFFDETDGYKVPPGTTIFSDEGNSFFENGDSVLLALGFQNHITYPSNVHQYLSPNDNRLHGTSKQSWRSTGTSKVDHSDDVASSLSLLNYLDRDIIKSSKLWWDRNMIKLTEEGVEELIASGPSKLSHLHKSWRMAYEIFTKENERNSDP